MHYFLKKYLFYNINNISFKIIYYFYKYNYKFNFLLKLNDLNL